MALPWLQRVELAFFATAFLCGAVAAAALTRTQGSFRGSCPLYGVAALNGSSLVLSRPTAPSLCSFVAGASGLLALYCLLLLFFWVYTSCIEGSHSCSDAQKTSWIPPGTAVQFYSNLHNAETSSWVNLVLWCVVLVLQVVQWKSEATPSRPLQRGDPEWSSETGALVGPRLSHS
ncbi:transmembrane protein 179B isoform X2 [Bubalus bubalis]|uniref:transmembrane protein 179B isoform X2 n=1 Tax=Bubalus bubalis TaxID=89462 RepID=UPI000DBC7969|nr:transmembrane protein 179B isoform X2 [Bubalus bubalis]